MIGAFIVLYILAIVNYGSHTRTGKVIVQLPPRSNWGVEIEPVELCGYGLQGSMSTIIGWRIRLGFFSLEFTR
jgi:hypothetical protein